MIKSDILLGIYFGSFGPDQLVHPRVLQYYRKYPLLKCISFDRQSLCLVAENIPTRNSFDFLKLEQFLLRSLPDSDLEICCNDVQDVTLFLQRVIKQEDVQLNREIMFTKDACEDENNNINKEFSREDLDCGETPSRPNSDESQNSMVQF